MKRLEQENPLGDCQLDTDLIKLEPYEPILNNITDFIIDSSRIYGGLIGVEIVLRASEGSLQRFQTAISLPTS